MHRCPVTTIIAAALLCVSVGGCSQPQSSNEPPASPASAPASTQGVAITLKTDPDPVRAGDNAFEAVVTENGKPVTDAVVSTEFFMAAMPSMNMPEMRSKAELSHAGNGVYRGQGIVSMSGNWDVTVRVSRDGRELGRKKMTITAR